MNLVDLLEVKLTKVWHLPLTLGSPGVVTAGLVYTEPLARCQRELKSSSPRRVPIEAPTSAILLRSVGDFL